MYLFKYMYSKYLKQIDTYILKHKDLNTKIIYKNFMHHKNSVKKAFKLSFILIQTLLFISSICISVISITIFLKGHKLFQIRYSHLFLILIMAILSFITAILGLKAISSRKKVQIFSFLFCTLILMNIQMIVSIKSSLLPEKSISWGQALWINLNDYQKEFFKKKFQCCGWKENLTCNNKISCHDVLYKLALSLRFFIEKSLIFMFFIESVGLAILAILKLKKNKN